MFAVFVIRGLLPFLIVWLANPGLNFVEIFKVAFSGSDILGLVEKSKSLLLVGGGVYLILVFLEWLFVGEKHYSFKLEHFIHKHSVWFYAASSIFITLVIYFAVKNNPLMALAASIGATVFFITDGFKKNAEIKEKELENPDLSAWSKIFYLEA